MQDEFALIQIKDGEHWKKLKEFKDNSCQVNDEELAPEGKDEESRDKLFQMLKDHAINLIAKSNKGKKGYLKMVW